MPRAVYGWRRPPLHNFGDELNNWILARLGVECTWAPPAQADLVLVGSVLEHLPPGWTGTVCGAGKLRENSEVDLSAANVIALRGRLSAARVRGVPTSVVLGDPGLLASKWVPQTVAKYDLGVIPHWSDQKLAQRFPYGHIIDVRRPPGEVITEIASCKRVVSSSLHGLVVADSFGIPRRAELFPSADKEGGDFKYRDYASIYDTDPSFGEFWRAPYARVEEVREQLRAALATATGTTPPRATIEPPTILPPRKKGRRPQLSVLVPYRHDKEDTEHRERVWAWLSQHWQQQLPHAEIIVGHDGSWPYSKCRSVNWAAERARGRILLILDADAYLDAHVIQQCADSIEEALAAGRKLWYVPYRRLYRLSEEYTIDLLTTDPAQPYAVPSPPRQEWLEPGGTATVNYGYLYGALAQMMPAEAFWLTGGMDPRFSGWGGEDISFLKSLDTLYALHEVTSNDICHLWHLRPGRNWKTRRWIGQGAGRTNSRLAQRYSVASGEAGFMRAVVEERAQPVPLSPRYARRI